MLEEKLGIVVKAEGSSTSCSNDVTGLGASMHQRDTPQYPMYESKDIPLGDYSQLNDSKKHPFLLNNSQHSHSNSNEN